MLKDISCQHKFQFLRAVKIWCTLAMSSSWAELPKTWKVTIQQSSQVIIVIRAFETVVSTSCISQEVNLTSVQVTESWHLSIRSHAAGGSQRTGRVGYSSNLKILPCLGVRARKKLIQGLCLQGRSVR